LHEITNNNGAGVVNVATSKHFIVGSTMYPHYNIRKCAWTSPDGKTHNQVAHILIDRRRHSSIFDVRSLRAAACDTEHYVVMAKIRERLAVKKQGSYKLHMEIISFKTQPLVQHSSLELIKMRIK
jgi:hypothetical protein